MSVLQTQPQFDDRGELCIFQAHFRHSTTLRSTESSPILPNYTSTVWYGVCSVLPCAARSLADTEESMPPDIPNTTEARQRRNSFLLLNLPRLTSVTSRTGRAQIQRARTVQRNGRGIRYCEIPAGELWLEEIRGSVRGAFARLEVCGPGPYEAKPQPCRCLILDLREIPPREDDSAGGRTKRVDPNLDPI
ncbi:hypothetical protein B0H12DRAFT_411519 [Mycena haematopus]|nr:hypothetical protein B0H12DRAFT_411519 [Mycena haematopus]